jgi:hypothetical protein
MCCVRCFVADMSSARTMKEGWSQSGQNPLHHLGGSVYLSSVWGACRRVFKWFDRWKPFVVLRCSATFAVRCLTHVFPLPHICCQPVTSCHMCGQLCFLVTLRPAFCSLTCEHLDMQDRRMRLPLCAHPFAACGAAGCGFRIGRQLCARSSVETWYAELHCIFSVFRTQLVWVVLQLCTVLTFTYACWAACCAVFHGLVLQRW